ncbi:MAG: S-layer homology domain-containing protein [Dysosmobacter sp.]|jgi:hypothetical protein|uniref:S-layer homology domain-containing protein n=1 Tax=Dysosmobacter sp. TaxID=2591382 RepID=UPI003D8EA947
MKKFLSLALALVMTMSLVTISAGAKDFTDGGKITYSDAVDVMSTIKVVDGYADGDFRPTNTLTRGAASKIICNMVLGPTTAGALPTSVAPFKDVPAGSTFAGYIAYCSQKGIINGYADGTFRPSGTLNGYAFMKMLLGALGYDGKIEGFTGANWSVNVAKLAMGIGLDDGLTEGFNGSKAVTREEACLYAFNTLQADMVEYSTTGSSITVGGVEIVTNPSKAEPVTTTANSNTIYDEKTEDGAKDDTVQFGERYFKDLEKNSDAYDKFGRPAAQWAYDDEEICVIADEADASYTEGVKAEDVYGDLNLKDSKDYKVYVDGKYQGDGHKVTIEDKDVDVELSGNGTLVEYYKDEARMIVVKTYIAEIDDVDTNKDDERIVSIGSMDYVTEEFEEDDMVLYTVGGKDSDEIQTMVAAEKLTGELTKKVGDKYTIDGTVYELSANKAEIDETVSPKNDVDFYLDSYGYIVKLDEAEGEVSVENLAFVLDAGTQRGKWAELLFADGKTKVVDTTKNVTDLIDEVVSFKVEDDGTYKLTDKGDESREKLTVTKFEKGDTRMDVSTGDDVKVDSKTVFVYAIDDNNDVEYKVYTGYKAAPGFETATVAAYAKSGKAATLVVVEVKNGDLSSDTSKLTFVAAQQDTDLVEDGDNTYYEFQAVVDGKITTLQVAYNATNLPALADAVWVFDKVTYNADDVVSKVEEATSSTDYTVTGISGKTSNDVVDLGGSTYAYTDDVKVFFVDGDKITEGSVKDIREDNDGSKNPYKNIYFTLDEGDVDMIVIEKK